MKGKFPWSLFETDHMYEINKNPTSQLPTSEWSVEQKLQ